MALLTTILLFAIALVLVVKSSDYFVHFAAKLAKRFGVSEFIIGLTLVAIGTSLPELTNAIISSLQGVNELALGNILGSNMANNGLSIGLTIFLTTIVINPRIYRREAYVLLASIALFLLVSINGEISRNEGLLFVVLFLIYLAYVGKVFGTLENSVRPAELNYFVDYFSRMKKVVTLRAMRKHYRSVSRGAKRFLAAWTGKTILDVLGLLVSMAVLLFASDMLVSNAVAFAALIGITSTAIGATIIALGTTTPELSVSIASVRKGYHRMLIGNIVGSNIVNLLLIIGVSAAIVPLQVSGILLLAVYPLLIASTLVFAAMLLRKGKVSRWFGATLLTVYVGFLAIMWFL